LWAVERDRPADCGGKFAFTPGVEAFVYGWDTLVLLAHLLEQGLPKSVIAARLGVSVKTIRRWIAAGLTTAVSEEGARPPRERQQAPTLLAPYHGIIETRLATYPALSAVRLLAECRAAGYAGSYTQLKRHVRTIRPQPAPEPVVRFDTAPGERGQVDFAEVRFPWGKRWALLVVLGYSRVLWRRFCHRQTLLTPMRGLEEAFAYLGGVPRELLFDQLRAVVIDDARPRGGRVHANPEFLRFVAHWGFRIRACRPYRAQTKGKVERPVHYLRHNFLYGREFLGDADVDAQRLQWLGEVANVRVHGTTGEVPWTRFVATERAQLLPLAPRPHQPLILPVTRQRADDRPAPTLPAIIVERRPLREYDAYATEPA
jgi:transposase